MDTTNNFVFILMLFILSNNIIATASKHISEYESSELLKAFNKPDRNKTSVYFLPVNEVNIVGELRIVPRNVTKLCFILENTHAHILGNTQIEKENEYDITELRHLINLEELWITSKDSSIDGIYRNHYGVKLKANDKYSNIFTSKLKRLHINVIIDGEFWMRNYNYSFTQLRSMFEQLDVLDFSGVNLFKNVEDVEEITGYSNNITALSLSGMMDQFQLLCLT